MAAVQAVFPAPAESPADESAVQVIAGQLETASCALDVQLAAVSGDWSSDPSLSSEEEDMLLEMEVEGGEGLSEPATVTADLSGTHPSRHKRKPEARPTVAGSRKKPRNTAAGKTFDREEQQNMLGAVIIGGQPY